jgi:hypothetical protein
MCIGGGTAQGGGGGGGPPGHVWVGGAPPPPPLNRPCTVHMYEAYTFLEYTQMVSGFE